MEDSPKRGKASNGDEDYHHRQKGKGKLFTGSVFCFPVADLDLTPKQI